MQTNKTKLPAIRLLVDSRYGVYVPQRFVDSYDMAKWDWSKSEALCQREEVESLKAEPHESEMYWEDWQAVLDNATFKQDGFTWRLYQDGDLWAICEELMTAEEKHNFGFEED